MLDLVQQALPLLWRATLMTVAIALASYGLALAVGLAVAVVRLFGPAPARHLCAVVVSFLCGTPLLLQVLLLYYGLPQGGVVLPAIPTVIAAFALHSGAFISEDLRGAIGAITRGQYDAGYALGLTTPKVLLLVVLPQALRSAVPTLGTRFIGVIKETSLASVVTVTELTRVAESVGSSSFRYLEMFTIVAGIYWFLSFLAARLQVVCEQRFGSRPGGTAT